MVLLLNIYVYQVVRYIFIFSEKGANFHLVNKGEEGNDEQNSTHQY